MSDPRTCRRGGRLPPAAALLRALLPLAALLSCGEPDGGLTQPAAPGPLDRETYERRLAAAAGAEVSSGRVLERAEEAAQRIEQRMERLAAQLGEPRGWREAFAALRRERPAGEVAVLASYRAELARAEAFVRERRLVSLPPAPPEVVVLENPSLRGGTSRWRSTTAAGSR